MGAAERRKRLRVCRRARDRAVVSRHSRLGLRGTIGFERVSDAAPLTLWPGAGEGQVGPALLRAHPLLSDGVVDTTGSAAFGRTLTFGSAEVQRWLEPLPLVRLGIAGFTDVARASRQTVGGRNADASRCRSRSAHQDSRDAGMLRADVAHGIRDGANALTVGWLF